MISEPYELTGSFAASMTPPTHTSEPVYKTKKTVFEQLPYPRSSSFERDFMIYLDGQDEVLAYTKVLPRMPLRIPYHDVDGYLRHYRPDFVIKTAGGMWLLETKGAGWDQQVNVEKKVGAAEEWCERASELSRATWSFIKIVDTDFARYSTLPFGQLTQAVQA